MREKDWFGFLWGGMNTLSLVIFILILMAFLIWQNIKSLELEEKLMVIQEERIKLYQDYHAELILYETLRRKVGDYARKNLGMVLPKKGDYRFMKIKDKQKLLKGLGRDGFK